MELKIGPISTEAAEERLGAAAGDRIIAALTEGLALACTYAAGEVQMKAAQSLKSRTGELQRGIGHWPGGSDEGLRRYIGVPADSPAAKYAYLLGEDDVTIVPIGHKYLAIPIGANLTGSGVARMKSPLDIPRDQIEFRGATVGVGDITGEDYTPLFALVTSVTICGRDVLYEALLGAEARMTDVVQETVDKVVA